jgi:hypothetical protein
MAGLWGILLSLLTAGNTILTPCITAGFETVKAINFRKGIQIVIWSRVGSCLFIYLAGFNIIFFILFMMGTAGISFAINKPKKYVTFASSVFNLGLVLFGIQWIKNSTKVLLKLEWFESIVGYTQQYPEIAFIAGLVFLLFAQSLFGTLVVALSFIESGLFDTQQALLFMYGSYLGEAILKVFYLTAFQGIFKQVMSLLPIIYSATFSIGSLLYITEFVFGVPFNSFLHQNVPDPKIALAHVNLAIHLISAIILSANVMRIQRFIYRYVWCEKEEKEEFKSVEIPTEILDDPLMTMALIKKEELRLTRLFPKYMDLLRNGHTQQDPHALIRLHNQLKPNLKKVRTVFSNLLNRSHYHPEICNQLLQGIEGQTLILSLEENLYEFSCLTDRLRKSTKNQAELSMKFLNFVEAMDIMLLTMNDVISSPGEKFHIDVLRKITRAREDFLKEVRDHYSPHLAVQDKADLIHLINLFESNIWIINKIADTLEEEVGQVDHGLIAKTYAKTN